MHARSCGALAAVLLFVLLAVPALAAPAAPASVSASTAAAPTVEAKLEYVCPMSEHAQVFDRPGTCPICGMDLVRRASSDALPPMPPLTDAGPPYVCPMSGHPTLYDRPGTCPICHMPLVSRRTLQPHAAAFVLYDGAAVLDWAGAYEVLGQAGVRVFTVAAEKRPITTAPSLKLMPDFPLGAAPAADIVVVPGGLGRAFDPRIVDWLRRQADHADAMLGVANGVFWLARAGLLDGLEATTAHGLLEPLRGAAPKARVVGDRSSVDAGRVLTASGAAAAQSAALRIVERTYGKERALDIARQLAIAWP